MNPEEGNTKQVDEYLAEVRKIVAMFTESNEVLDEPSNTFFRVVYMIVSVIAGKTSSPLHSTILIFTYFHFHHPFKS